LAPARRLEAVKACPRRSGSIQARRRQSSAALLVGGRRNSLLLATPHGSKLRSQCHARKPESLGCLGQISAGLIHCVTNDYAVKVLQRSPIEIALAARQVASQQADQSL
jgi:hypothetical protein